MQPTTGTQDTAATRQMPPVAAAGASSPPPAPMVVGSNGDTCPKCNSMVAADQRYCIECGERRGEPRLPFMDGRTAAQPNVEVLPAPLYPAAGYLPPQAPPKTKLSSGLALLATIATLLLAMGVGVLIGNKGDSSGAAAQQPIILGSGASAATGASGATAAAAGAGAAAAASTTDAKDGVDASALAKKNGVKLAPPDVDLGEKCEKGSVGCDDSGKFSGDYFK
ncbi:MAG: hypothetical protein JHD02_02215 [Thermoleophilaceae bacterium]|nr:hypothetical protein [Thermoleophilaceae bacterium]